MFSKKATKIDKIFTVDLTVTTYCQIDSEDFCQFLWPSQKMWTLNKLTPVSMTKLWNFFKELHLIHLSDSYIKSGMKKLIAALPCLQKLYIDAMQCTWNIYCLSEIMQWISVAKELQFLTFKMRSDQGNITHEPKSI